jgi:hypothetical protein
MSLTVEDGSIVSGAESYVSVADADAYFTKMANAVWTGDDTVKEAALRRSTQYLDSEYLFKGNRVQMTQALRWPRTGLVVDDVIIPFTVVPEPIRTACMELAVRSLSAPLFTDRAAQEVLSVRVGPISQTLSASGSSGQLRFIAVERLLRGYVVGNRNTIAIERAS